MKKNALLNRNEKRGDYALRLYVDGDGSGSLLCREPGHECPQWWYKPDNRYTFPTWQEAKAFVGILRSEWEEFRAQDIRVVRVVPPRGESYVEVWESAPVTIEEYG